jgi:hypothetical protein
MSFCVRMISFHESVGTVFDRCQSSLLRATSRLPCLQRQSIRSIRGVMYSCLAKEMRGGPHTKTCYCIILKFSGDSSDKEGKKYNLQSDRV